MLEKPRTAAETAEKNFMVMVLGGLVIRLRWRVEEWLLDVVVVMEAECW